MRMEPARYWRSLTKDEKYQLADLLSVTKVYLSSVMNGHFKASKTLALRIELKTDGDVSKRDIRPDVNRNEWIDVE